MRKLKLTNLTEGEFHYQGQLDQYLEEWLYPRRIQSDRSLFSEE